MGGRRGEGGRESKREEEMLDERGPGAELWMQHVYNKRRKKKEGGSDVTSLVWPSWPHRGRCPCVSVNADRFGMLCEIKLCEQLHVCQLS